MENGKRQQLKTICRNQNEISKAQANRNRKKEIKLKQPQRQIMVRK